MILSLWILSAAALAACINCFPFMDWPLFRSPHDTTVSPRLIETKRMDEGKEALLSPRTSGDDIVMISSASAVAAAIRKASTSLVEFVQMIEQDGKNKGLVLWSSDFQSLCMEQLDLFRRIVDPDALQSVMNLQVYVRPVGSYVMDRLELR
ncbi:hypothetical protein L2E82_22522 [Cichorium intybus]|uniref:Uncharacterized protein n=1 Tax=Cichorium intybus TaxID=13427 RepID=A0ACB9DYZ0_CICIN|nr:hypothetical protein L2E82_22522 [Cichorium intybus]